MQLKKQKNYSLTKFIKFFIFRISLEIVRFLEKKGVLKNKHLNKTRLRKTTVGNYIINVNKFHTIDYNLYKNKAYSLNLPRIAAAITDKYKDSSILDIGANVGDTVALIRSAGVTNNIICVEGLEYYHKILLKNLPLFNNVISFNLFLSDVNNSLGEKIEIKDGTARVLSSSEKTSDKNIGVRLDDFIKINNLSNIKLLKIDTDGYDFKILRGGINFISENHPTIFFEYDNLYLSKNGDDGLSIFDDFINAGYSKALYYDNYGRLLCSADLKNKNLLKDLYGYIENYSGSFRYYDVCLFHEDDNDLFNILLEKERVASRVNRKNYFNK